MTWTITHIASQDPSKTTPRIADEKDRPVAYVLQADKAGLLAAAPELLEACQAMIEWDAREKDHAVDFYARLDLCRAAFDKARAAIKKATGQ